MGELKSSLRSFQFRLAGRVNNVIQKVGILIIFRYLTALYFIGNMVNSNIKSNPNVKLKITKKGEIIFYGISKKQKHRYTERLDNNETTYTIDNNYYKKNEIVIHFHRIEIKLFSIFKQYYSLKDDRKCQLPISKETLYFQDKQHIIYMQKEMSPIIISHFAECKNKYRHRYTKDAEVLILKTVPPASYIDINNNFRVINNINCIYKDDTIQDKIAIIKEIHDSLELPQNKPVFSF